MQRNTLKIFTLIGALSAAGFAYADSGFISGHDTLVPQTAGTNSGKTTKRYVGHNGAFLDGKVDRANADIHHQNMQRTDMTMQDHMDMRGPLPPEAGANR